MCIRDSGAHLVLRDDAVVQPIRHVLAADAQGGTVFHQADVCLLYTSDAADERSSVDLGGRRIIKKNNNVENSVELAHC